MKPNSTLQRSNHIENVLNTHGRDEASEGTTGWSSGTHLLCLDLWLWAHLNHLSWRGAVGKKSSCRPRRRAPLLDHRKPSYTSGWRGGGPSCLHRTKAKHSGSQWVLAAQLGYTEPFNAGSHQLPKLNPGKANTKYSRTKLAWFNRLIRHSARKRDGLILQSTQKSFNKHISISSEMNIAWCTETVSISTVTLNGIMHCWVDSHTTDFHNGISCRQELWTEIFTFGYRYFSPSSLPMCFSM